MRVHATARIAFTIFLSLSFPFTAGGQENHVVNSGALPGSEQSQPDTVSTDLYLGTEMLTRIFDEASRFVDSDAFKQEVGKPEFRAEILDRVQRGLPSTPNKNLNEILKKSVETLMESPEIKEYLEQAMNLLQQEMSKHGIPMHTRASIFYPQAVLQEKIEKLALKIIPHFATEIAELKFGRSTRAILAKKLLAREGALSDTATSPVAIQLKEELRKSIQQTEKEVVALFTRELSLKIGDKGLSTRLNLIPVPRGGTALIPEKSETVFSATQIDMKGARHEILRQVIKPLGST